MNGKTLYEAINQIEDCYIDEVYKDIDKRRIDYTGKKLFTLILAATMLLAALTACAAEVFRWDGRLSELLNLSKSQEESIEGMWSKMDSSKEENGVTITLDSAITDDNTMFLLYDVKLPEEMDMDREYNFEIEQMDGQGWLSYGGNTTGSTNCSVIKKDKKQNRLTCLMTYSSQSGKLSTQKMRIWFKNLCSYKIVNDEITDERLEKKINLTFYIRPQYTANIRNYTMKQTVKGRLNRVKLQTITITPISISIQGKCEDTFQFRDREKNIHEAPFIQAIHLKDGSILACGDSSMSVNTFEQLQFKSVFEQVTDPSLIQEIEFYDGELVSLKDITYSTRSKVASLNTIRIWIARGGLGITMFLMGLSAASMLSFCNHMYQEYEKQSKDSFEDFCRKHRKSMKIDLYAYQCYRIFLLLLLMWTIFLIITNWFTTMTIFIGIISILWIVLLSITIRSIKAARSELQKISS